MNKRTKQLILRIVRENPRISARGIQGKILSRPKTHPGKRMDTHAPTAHQIGSYLAGIQRAKHEPAMDQYERHTPRTWSLKQEEG